MSRRALMYLLLLLVCLGLTVDAAMHGRWFGTALMTVASLGMAFHVTHPQAWWDAKARQVFDRLERER